VEISPALEKLQRENLKSHSEKITWQQSSEALPDKPMIIVANEFFDALPVRQIVKKDDGELEIRIGLKNDRFFLTGPKEEYIYETSAETIEIIKRLAEKIIRNGGAALLIDYGYAIPNGKSSLQAVKNHMFHDFLENPGAADLTAHVNFGE